MSHLPLSAVDLTCTVDCTATCDRDDTAFVTFRMFWLPLAIVQYGASSLAVGSDDVLGCG